MLISTSRVYHNKNTYACPIVIAYPYHTIILGKSWSFLFISNLISRISLNHNELSVYFAESYLWDYKNLDFCFKKACLLISIEIHLYFCTQKIRIHTFNGNFVPTKLKYSHTCSMHINLHQLVAAHADLHELYTTFWNEHIFTTY